MKEKNTPLRRGPNGKEPQQVVAPKEITALPVIQGQPKESREDLKSLFVEWLVMPRHFRSPHTQREFGARHGISEQTLSDWKSDVAVQKQVRRLVNIHAFSRFADVMHGICEAATDGNMFAAKLYLQYVMGWNEKIEYSGRVEVDANWDAMIGDKVIDRLPIPTRAEPAGTRVN